MTAGAGVSVRGAWRRLALGLPTILGLARRGFFIPYRYADDVPGPGRLPGYAALETLFEERSDVFADLLGEIEDLAGDIERIGGGDAPAPRWRQQWFPRLDAAAAYTLVRRLQPRRIVEIGGGHSTRFFVRAVADGGLDTVVTCIDPAPRAPVDGSRVRLLETTVQRAGAAPYAALEPADILSIDSSHILMPGTDVDFLLNRVAPTLPSGVFLHVHDVFLPDDYPAMWAWRGYNEQLGIATLLTGGGWNLVWSSRYVTTRMTPLLAGHVASRLLLPPEAWESSLWLEKA